MLYIWPYFTFFSIPLLVGPLFRPILPYLPKEAQAFCKATMNAACKPLAPTLLASSVFALGCLGAVHFNTIIHPYTLADNRHYVFYVFRILRRYPSLWYLAIPVYLVCVWLVIGSLSSSPIGVDSTNPQRDGRPITSKNDHQPCKISFIVVWLATTALSIVTAPLVEPRYFIVPWIIWRLHVAYSPASLSNTRCPAKTPYDLRLVLETAWLLVINAIVCYTFLYRPFAWPNEPGNKQRFIW